MLTNKELLDLKDIIRKSTGENCKGNYMQFLDSQLDANTNVNKMILVIDELISLRTSIKGKLCS